MQKNNALATHEAVLESLYGILDPEMPVNIVDLGIVAEVRVEDARPDRHPGACVAVDITPTFVGCPALDMLRRQIEQRVGRLAGVSEVRVSFVNTPVWSVEHISDAGRDALRAHGVVVPDRGGLNSALRPPPAPVALGVRRGGAVSAEKPEIRCPFCESAATELESPFGPTRCRMIYYCTSCKNSFERLKPI